MDLKPNWSTKRNNSLRTGLEVSDILVTQVGLRDQQQLPQMTRFLRTGGMFDEETLGSYAIRKSLDRVSPLIEIAKFEDGVMAIHNGHHRAIAAFLSRANRKIYSDEFFIRNWKYSDYKDIVLPYWVTPFDVLTELRVADLADWKKQVRDFYILNGDTKTVKFIQENKAKYAVNRTFYTVGDMVSRLGLYSLKG